MNSMERKGNLGLRFHSFCEKALWIIAIVLCFLIMGLNFIYTAEVSYDEFESVSMPYSIGATVGMIVIMAVILFVLTVMGDKIEKINERKLFKIFSLVYAVAAAYLILNVDTTLRADASATHAIAQNVLDEWYPDFSELGYVSIYPHQTGIVLYNSILARFSRNVILNFVVNFFFIIGINWNFLRISEMLFKNKKGNVLTVMIMFAFLPQLFFILFAYGLIPGFFCLSMAFCYTLRFLEDDKIRNMMVLIAFSAMAVILKQNNLIGVLAIIIFLFLVLLRKEKKIKTLVLIASLVLCMLVPSKMIIHYYEQKTGYSLDQGIPSVLWIAMGTDIDNNGRAPGWFDRSNYETYLNSNYDSKESARQGMEKLEKNIDKICQEPMEAIRFFKNKTVSQWCEPMYQSVWSGPLEDLGQYSHTKTLQSLYNGGEVEDRTALFCKFVSLLIWVFAFIFLIRDCKETCGWELLFLFFIGGVLFHTIWEGKSQYIYPYVFSLIPFAAFALTKTAACFQEAMKKLRSKGDC